jgi:hypothetical protein
MSSKADIYHSIMRAHEADLRRLYHQERREHIVPPVMVLSMNNPWLVAQVRNCSVAEARELIAQMGPRGKYLNAYRAMSYADAEAFLGVVCREEWREATAMLRDCPDRFLAAVVEMDDRDEHLCRGGMIRLVPIVGEMTDPDQLDD